MGKAFRRQDISLPMFPWVAALFLPCYYLYKDEVGRLKNLSEESTISLLDDF